MKKGKVRSIYRAVPVREDGSIEVEGKYYVVGDAALLEPHLCSHIATTKQLIKAYPIFIKYVEEKTGKKVDAISVPLEDFYRSMKKGGGIVEELEEKTNKKVLPQGLTGLYALRRKVDLPKRVLLMDAGMRTLNAAVLAGDSVEFCKSLYDEASMAVLLSYFRKQIEEKYPEVPTTRGLIEKAFEQGFFSAGFSTVELNEEKQKAIEMFTERFVNIIEREFSNLSIPFEKVVIIGGVAHYLDEKLFEELGNIPVFVAKSEPEFLNVEGMSLMMGGGTCLDLGYGWAKYCVPGGEDAERPSGEAEG